MNPNTVFPRPQHAIFELSYAHLDERELRLGYALRGGPDADIEFKEVLRLPPELPAPDIKDPVVLALIDGCHRAFGTSYFKAAIPPKIVALPVSDADADFWDELYSLGMGEFYCRNGLSPRDRAHFPRGAASVQAAGRAMDDDASLVLIGGGKDSALVADIVRHSGVPAAALSLGNAAWIQRSAQASQLNLHSIQRSLDKRLLELNARGAWNGHIPISTCIAFISLLAAYAGGFAHILVGNERGAEEANDVFDGVAINHQWSKTLHFEQAFRRWCARHFAQGPSYFSLLRPMSEIHIAQLFSQLPEQLPNFTSCNVNFRQAPGAPGHRWCARCPKCVFVYLLLAPHLSEEQTDAVFGSNILADPANLPHLKALLGVLDVKPWECVGTLHECRLSFTALARQQRLNSALLALAEQHPEIIYGDEVETGFEAAWQAELQLSSQHCLSPAWKERLDAYISAH